MAAGLGFEPRLTDSESAGLPLADPANRAHSTGILAKKQSFLTALVTKLRLTYH